MPTYFSLAEFLRSDTAAARNIDNTPSWEVVDHLRDLAESLLDPLRVAWGKAIRVTSGYRCAALNTAVGGSATSAHLRGYAADLQTTGDFAAFRDFVTKWAKTSGVKFDQIIVESDGRTNWIHVGLYNSAGQQRGQLKTMTK